MKGTLYIVSTPIGNLEDITLRAIKLLKEVDIIACEDTRHTKKLLSAHKIINHLESYHEHNEIRKSQKLLLLLKSGKNIALVSNAGTPCISDPGYRIVKLASENEINVVPVPGPSAVVSAVAISGLPTDRFLFLGFLPRTKKRCKELLESTSQYTFTQVFYESPKRLVNTLELMHSVLGDRNISVSRELTKKFEETLRGNVSGLIKKLREKESIKGEITIVVEGYSNKSGDISREAITNALKDLKKGGFSLKDAVSKVTGELNGSKNEVYKVALGIWN